VSATVPGRLEGERTAIRPTTAHDAHAMLELRVRNAAFLAPYDPLRPRSFLTLAGQGAMLAADERARRDDRGYGFVVLDRTEGDVPIGRVNLFNVVRGPRQSAGMGYWLDEGHGGRGHATAAVRLACEAAFDHLGLHRLEPAVMPRNARSARVLEKAGFRREGRAVRYLEIAGVWEDHDLFGLTAEEHGAQAPVDGPAQGRPGTRHH
jgi:ribosomal-protein-alanine N-acetyltransferase